MPRVTIALIAISLMAIALLRPQGLQHFDGAHRELAHADAGGAIDGVGDRRHRRYDGHFADAA